MRKFILALVFVSLLFTIPKHTKTDVSADNTFFEEPVCMTVNGSYIKSDTSGYLENGCAMVPIRFAAEALCADSITWDEKSSTVEIVKQSTVIVLKKDSKTAQLNGNTVTASTEAVIKNGRLFAPVRFIAEALNANVKWDFSTYTVHITANGVDVPASLTDSRNFSDDDIYWLSRIVSSESGGESMEGKIAVANVVLNRVESPLFANNIYDVIFDTNYGVQFTPIANGTIYNTPLGDSIIAAKRALLGENHAGGSLYFLNPKIASSFWIVNNRAFFKSIGNHDFYL